MGGHLADERDRQGYELEQTVLAALPLPVWRLEMDVERERPVSAAEDTVLDMIHAGVTDIGGLAYAMGMGTDTRLAEQVLVKLLGAGAVDTLGSGFMITQTGESWRAAGSAKGREQVSFEVRLDPVLDALEWVDHEPAMFATPETWTIELPPVGDAELLDRRTQVADLVRAEGLPDDRHRAPGQRRPPVELRGLAVVARRVHWREVRLDIWRHPMARDFQIIGYVADAENPPLTKLLAQHEVNSLRKRIAPRGVR